MTPTPEKIGDLSESARVQTEVVLLAGSAGYPHFLKHLAKYISPDEADTTAHRFRRAARLFWIIAGAYILLHITLNQLIGPYSLRLAHVTSDFLRAALFITALLLAKKMRIAVALQLLLPLAVI